MTETTPDYLAKRLADQQFKVGARVRLTSQPSKKGLVRLVSRRKGAVALVVERDCGKCKGDFMHYPVDWWEGVL